MPDNDYTLHLRRFAPHDSALVVTWPQSPTEAQWWAGPHVAWPVPIESVQRWHADPDVQPFVLAHDSLPLGYGELWIDAEAQEIELARLIIAPEYRNQGFGTRLVARLLDKARQTAYTQVFLRVVPENHAARACYQRAGFTAVRASDQQLFNQGQPVAYVWLQYLPIDS